MIHRPHLRLLLLTALLGTSALRAQSAPPTGRERLSLDRGWLFHLGDIPFPVISGHQQSYNNAKAGRASGAAAASFDDSAWREVDLPHDWAVEGPFDEKANLSQGYRARGFGWYRRYFKLDAADRGRHLELQLDGVATHCTVWINGVLAERNWCGYTSVYVDLTPFAKFGADVNTIAVRVDADTQEGWWYEGAGIYRHTWLVKRNAVHLATDGVYANPVRAADGSWSVPVEVTLGSSDRTTASVAVEATLLDPAGKPVVSATTSASVAPFQNPVAKLTLPVAGPRLWSVDEPTLYSVHIVVQRDGVVIDDTTQPCGFRTIRFDADRGFFLNDQPLKLKGTCNHQDHAGVGVAVPDSLWDFRVRRLKEMGSNAYRCAHHAPAKEFLEACDRLGMLVMDENRNFGSSPEYLRQMEWLVRRDRNHPSVILWSVFNEEPFQGTEQGYEMVRRMAAATKALDSTRPVTAAQSNGNLNPVNASQAADVAGFNYQHRAYDAFHAANPTKPMTSSEDTSAVQTRGEYTTDRKRSVLDAYDTQFQPWGLTHRNAWKAIAERPFVAGGFVWTGFDYRGEPQPLQWPATGSSFGIMDLCGFPKTAFYIHQAHWIETRPVLQLAPHWTWPGREGQPVKVLAITNAEQVTLTLNGQSLGTKSVDRYDFVSWEVPYAPGRLEAVATRGGAEVARFIVETTGAPAALQLVADRATLAGDGDDAQPITVQAVDAQGRVVPTAMSPVKFELTGAADIIGLNNGNPNCHEPEKGTEHTLFNGLAQIIVQSQAGATGALKLRATSTGLAPAELTIPLVTAAPRPFVPAVRAGFVVQNWRSSPASAERPDPNQTIADSDQNTWSTVQPGRLPARAAGKWAIYRASFTAPAHLARTGGGIAFASLTGRAEIFLDGKLLGQKDDSAPGPLRLTLPAGSAEHTLSVLIEAPATGPAGLSGAITLESEKN